jgi:acetyl/propionyl-CoA carboxylase alpha subunit
MRYIATYDGKDRLIDIVDEHNIIVNDGGIGNSGGPGSFGGIGGSVGTGNSVSYVVDFEMVGEQPVYSLLLDGKSYEAYVYPTEEGWQVLLLGSLYLIQVEDEREKRLRASLGGRMADHGEFHLKSPMPGLVVSIPVKEGQKVTKGEVLVILESMKMQNELKSPRTGIVTRCRVEVGDSVEQRETLLSVV